MDVYVSPEQPRWSPRSEADLQTAIDHQIIDETHYLEAKKLIEPGKAANRELARDLASFAIDGGTVIIGVDEDKASGKFALASQPLAGLAERIESVCYTIPDPPLTVTIDTIPGSASDGTGYLLVHVPRSPNAPHMVDGRYLGRGEKQKRYLTDAEVARLHALRRRVDDGLARLLDAEIGRDPFPSGARAHLFLVAEPTAPPPDMLVGILDDSRWRDVLREIVATAGNEPLTGGTFVPGLHDAQDTHRRSSGAAVSAYGVSAARAPNPEASDPEQYGLDVEFRHDGGLRLYLGRLSEQWSNYGRTYDAIFESAPVRFTRHLIKIAALVAERSGYLGSWGLGLAATNLRGRPAIGIVGNWMTSHPGPTYDADTERRVTVATYAELTQRPGPVTDRLVGHFLRAYGLRDRYQQDLQAPVDTDDAS